MTAEPVTEKGSSGGGSPPDKPSEPVGAWTVNALISGVKMAIHVPLEIDGVVKDIVLRPIMAHELAQINKTFADQDILMRMAAMVSTCSVDPKITFEEAVKMLPGHLQKCFTAIYDGSGYTEKTRKNLTE